jgi:hypothetical protein
VANLGEWLLAACAAFKNESFDFAQARPGVPRTLTGSLADVERACAETGWHTFTGDGPDLHVVVPTRAGAYTARLESSAPAEPRFVVELIDLAGQPDVRRRATAAL